MKSYKSFAMQICFFTIILSTFVGHVSFGQRINRRQAQQQAQCITPENQYGWCTTLSNCPGVVNVFRNTNQYYAQQYVFALQRACNSPSINGDPVICCSPQYIYQPVTEAPAPPVITAATRAPVPTTRATQRPTISSNVVDRSQRSSCRGPDTRPGLCADLKDCQVLVNELYARQNDEQFAKYLRASNSICGGIGSIVCCPSGAAQTISTRGPVIQNSDEVPRVLPTVEQGCGYTKNSFKKIVGGEVSKKGAWPWIALLGYEDGYSTSPFKCGGTLITARHVLTAAHCIRRDLRFVRFGEHDLTTDDEAPHVDIRIARTESHADYNKRNGRSDIALLYMEENVRFNEFISPICLPATRELRSKSFVGHTPFVAGWGRTMEGGQSATVLQQLQIPIYENDVCMTSYRNMNRLISNDQFDAAVICAGVLAGGNDTCQGDSGGPLMIPVTYQNDVRYYLIGIVSYGIGCARPNVPGVYTSTQYFIDWIVQKLRET